MKLTVELPLPARELSPNAHIHWREKHRATVAARKSSWYWFQRSLPKAWRHAPVLLDVIYRYATLQSGYRPRDVQNAIAALKPAIDGMVDAGVVPDDSWEWVQWGRVQIVRCIAGEQPGVRIEVRQMATASADC